MLASRGVAGAGPRYRILRRLGHGGMAEVLEAELIGELGFVRKVAIKRMTGELGGDATRRFLDEARIASRLHHANIVAVVDVGVLDDVPFQVLELVDGIDALSVIERSGAPLSLELALVIANAVAHALDHAHHAVDERGDSLGIIHRDVKPSNILLSWAGDIKLGDFGIAFAHERAAKTEAGIVGTRGFMAPEQRTRGQLDPRSDVYALGLTLHVLATGKNPLEEAAVELAVLGGEPVPLDPALPDDVRKLLACVLAPRAVHRPTAAELAASLDELLKRRATGDPRTLSRDALRPFDRPRGRPGALDQLLGIELVREDPVADVSRFRTIAPAPPAPARSRRRLLPLALVALVGLAAVAIWQRVPREVPARITEAPRDARVVDGAAIDARPAPIDARAPTTDARSITTDARMRSAKPQVDAAILERGYLQVRGEATIGLEVIVDGGAYAGYAPRAIEVPVGRHRVEVEQRDGTRLPAKRIEVRPSHTKLHPATLSW
ncbi:MAG: serine/threonine-protein kinase [Kofleriaceae bacterium]